MYKSRVILKLRDVHKRATKSDTSGHCLLIFVCFVASLSLASSQTFFCCKQCNSSNSLLPATALLFCSSRCHNEHRVQNYQPLHHQTQLQQQLGSSHPMQQQKLPWQN